MKTTTTTRPNWATIKQAERESMTDTARTIADTFSKYEQDTTAVLANLDRTSPAPIIRQLQNARRADETARANPATAEEHDEQTARHEETRESIEECDRIAHRMTATQAERVSAWQEGATLRTIADNARETARDLAKVIARTLSDRADLVQIAALAELEEPTPQELATATRRAEERGEELTAEELHERAKTRHRRNAIARHIRAQRGMNALNGMSTETKPATPEQVSAWIASGKGTGADNKQPTKSGTIALEWREQTKTRPAGWYIVRRYYTTNQWTSIEQYDEQGGIDGYIRTQNQYTADLDAIERLESLCARADLTAREREFLSVFCGKGARKAGADARRAYHTEQGRKATNAGANGAEYTARKLYAFTRVGLTTRTAQDTFFHRMTRRLAQAVQIESTCTTPAELAEHNARYWAHLMTDSRRGTATEQTNRPDIISALAQANAGKTHAPAIKWTESNAPTAPTSGKDYRAEEVERRAEDNARRALQAMERGTARATARMTARAEETAYRAQWSARPAHTMTAHEWNATPSASRIALLDRIHADGKRLEIVKG